jgi:hypothetical protein
MVEDVLFGDDEDDRPRRRSATGVLAAGEAPPYDADAT